MTNTESPIIYGYDRNLGIQNPYTAICSELRNPYITSSLQIYGLRKLACFEAVEQTKTALRHLVERDYWDKVDECWRLYQREYGDTWVGIQSQNTEAFTVNRNLQVGQNMLFVSSPSVPEVLVADVGGHLYGLDRTQIYIGVGRRPFIRETLQEHYGSFFPGVNLTFDKHLRGE